MNLVLIDLKNLHLGTAKEMSITERAYVDGYMWNAVYEMDMPLIVKKNFVDIAYGGYVFHSFTPVSRGKVLFIESNELMEYLATDKIEHVVISEDFFYD